MLKSRNFGLDLVRCIAIVSVLLCHTIPLFADTIESSGETAAFKFFYWAAGYYGVEIFFILSGYLIGSIFVKTIIRRDSPISLTKELLNFLVRRWFRTIPNFLLFFLVFWFLAYALDQKMPGTYLLFRVSTLTQGLFFGGSDFYAVSWSLAVEEWFYLLFPAFFLGFYPFVNNKNRAFLAALLVMFAIPAFLKIMFSLTKFNTNNAELVFHYSTLYRLDSIFYGLLLAYIWQKDATKRFLLKWRRLLFGLGCAGSFFSLFIAAKSVFVSHPSGFDVYVFQIVCSVSLLLTFPYFIEWKAKGTYTEQMVHFLSITSYSLYLVHVPVSYIQLASATN